MIDELTTKQIDQIRDQFKADYGHLLNRGQVQRLNTMINEFQTSEPVPTDDNHALIITLAITNDKWAELAELEANFNAVAGEPILLLSELDTLLKKLSHAAFVREVIRYAGSKPKSDSWGIEFLGCDLIDGSEEGND